MVHVDFNETGEQDPTDFQNRIIFLLGYIENSSVKNMWNCHEDNPYSPAYWGEDIYLSQIYLPDNFPEQSAQIRHSLELAVKKDIRSSAGLVWRGDMGLQRVDGVGAAYIPQMGTQKREWFLELINSPELSIARDVVLNKYKKRSVSVAKKELAATNRLIKSKLNFTTDFPDLILVAENSGLVKINTDCFSVEIET